MIGKVNVKKAAFCLIAAASAAPFPANGGIKGRVCDVYGSLIEGAVVVLKGKGISETTDYSGAFSFPDSASATTFHFDRKSSTPVHVPCDRVSDGMYRIDGARIDPRICSASCRGQPRSAMAMPQMVVQNVDDKPRIVNAGMGILPFGHGSRLRANGENRALGKTTVTAIDTLGIAKQYYRIAN